MSGTDEPVLSEPYQPDDRGDRGDRGDSGEPGGTGDPEAIGERIRELVHGEPFAVLGTQREAQPYGSVIAVAFTQDLRHALFATPVTTRKYRLLSGSNRVSVVVDDRARWPDDLMRIQAVTLTGRAVEVERGEGFERWARILVERHPYLHAFVQADSSALFRIDVLRYFHVERFQEVHEWVPPSS